MTDAMSCLPPSSSTMPSRANSSRIRSAVAKSRLVWRRCARRSVPRCQRHPPCLKPTSEGPRAGRARPRWPCVCGSSSAISRSRRGVFNRRQASTTPASASPGSARPRPIKRRELSCLGDAPSVHGNGGGNARIATPTAASRPCDPLQLLAGVHNIPETLDIFSAPMSPKRYAPISRQRRPLLRATALRGFILVVRKDQVEPPP